jgi:iron(III) transport system permease protein
MQPPLAHSATNQEPIGVRIAFTLLVLVVVYLAAAPLFLIVASSFGGTADALPLETFSFSLANFQRTFTDPQLPRLMLNTAEFTVGSVIIGIGGAIGFAWLIERSDLPFRHVIFVLILAPMVIPNMVYAMAWIQLLNPNNGMLNAALIAAGMGFIHLNGYSMAAMIFVQGVLTMSQAYLLIAAPFRMIDPSWEEQSEICGKSQLGTLLRITVPVLKPSLFAIVAFFTVVGMETFDIPGTIGLPAQIHLFSTRIYGATHPDGGQLPDYGRASTLALMLVMSSYVLISVYRRQTRSSHQFATITGRAFRSKRTALGPWRIPIFICVLVTVGGTIVLPIGMLVWRSLVPFYVHPWLASASLVSLNAYRTFIENDIVSAIYNTSIVTLAAALLTSVLGAATAWFVLRAPLSSRARGSLSAIAFLPQAVPSVVIGLAVMFLYLSLPIAIYGTIWIIVIALVTKYLAYSTASMMAAQIQISPELEEASYLSGASWFRTYRRISAPLIAPAFVSAFLWVCIQGIRELGTAIMLYSEKSQVLSTKVWNLWEGGYVAQACAVGVVTILFLLILLCVPHVFKAMRFATRHLLGWMVPQPAAIAPLERKVS